MHKRVIIHIETIFDLIIFHMQTLHKRKLTKFIFLYLLEYYIFLNYKISQTRSSTLERDGAWIGRKSAINFVFFAGFHALK